jgi:hypothetical protein
MEMEMIFNAISQLQEVVFFASSMLLGAMCALAAIGGFALWKW